MMAFSTGFSDCFRVATVLFTHPHTHMHTGEYVLLRAGKHGNELGLRSSTKKDLWVWLLMHNTGKKHKSTIFWV